MGFPEMYIHKPAYLQRDTNHAFAWYTFKSGKISICLHMRTWTDVVKPQIIKTILTKNNDI